MFCFALIAHFNFTGMTTVPDIFVFTCIAAVKLRHVLIRLIILKPLINMTSLHMVYIANEIKIYSRLIKVCPKRPRPPFENGKKKGQMKGPNGDPSLHLKIEKWFSALVFHADEYWQVPFSSSKIHFCMNMCWLATPRPFTRSMDPLVLLKDTSTI